MLTSTWSVGPVLQIHQIEALITTPIIYTIQLPIKQGMAVTSLQPTITGKKKSLSQNVYQFTCIDHTLTP